MERYVLFLMLFSSYALHNVHSAWSSGEEKTIRTNVLSGYDRLTRPEEITNVSIALNLLTINDLDIKTQQLSLTGWLTVEWEDSRLTWTNTAGTESPVAFFVYTEIWWPEIFVDNSMASVDIINNNNLLYRVSNTGKVDWEIPRIFTTSCTVDITYFPFDTQTCGVEVVSWAYTKDEVILSHLRSDVNIEDYQEHGEFIYKGSSVSSSELTETTSSGAVEKYAQLKFDMTLQRRPDFYITSIIIPVVLTSYLIILVFVLPVDSGEKIGYSLTVLLALAVLLTLILDTMPSTALFTSYLSVYLSTTLVLSCGGVIGSVFVIRLHFRDTEREIPSWMQNIVVCCARASLWSGCKHPKNKGIVKVAPAGEHSDGKVIPTESDQFTWPEVAAIFDWFLFVYMTIITTMVLFIFMMILGIGGVQQQV